MTHFRKQRAERIKQKFPDIDALSVLDLGGSLHFWRAEVHLQKAKDMAALFPAADLVTERFLGMPKSYLAFGGAR